MQQFSPAVYIVFLSGLLYSIFFALNYFLFSSLNFSESISWVLLPAGMRLFLTLIFSFNGALGISLASMLISWFFFFSDDPITGMIAGILSGLSPYLARYLVFKNLQISSRLDQLNGSKLLQCSLIFSVTSPLLHQSWYFFRNHNEDFVHPLLVMIIGDLTGTLIVIYLLKFTMEFIRSRSTQPHKK
jgi:hypothetical protein